MRIRHPSPLDLVKLPSLMAVTSGRPEIRIGLVDGPVAVDHPDLARENVRSISAARGASHAKANGAAYQHGTFVAGILAAKRTSPAPGICPQCTLLVRSIFPETTQHNGHIPTATPENLARAILECIEAGARIVNLSVALAQTSPEGERQIQEALDHAARRGVLVVAAAGNAGSIGSSPITRHPGAIPVVAYDSAARPMGSSNLGAFDWQARPGRSRRQNYQLGIGLAEPTPWRQVEPALPRPLCPAQSPCCGRCFRQRPPPRSVWRSCGLQGRAGCRWFRHYSTPGGLIRP